MYEAEIEQVLKVFHEIDDNNLEINKLVNPIPVYQSKPYYPRRSPIDL